MKFKLQENVEKESRHFADACARFLLGNRNSAIDDFRGVDFDLNYEHSLGSMDSEEYNKLYGNIYLEFLKAIQSAVNLIEKS